MDWKHFLERKRISRSELARLLGVAPPMVTEWMNCKSRPGYKYIKKLHEIGMTEIEIFCDVEGEAKCEKKEQAVFDCNMFLNRKGLTRKELAEKLGFKETAVGNWCAGNSTPNYCTIAELIRLGIVAEELFGSNLAEILRKNEKESPANHDAVTFEARVEDIVLGMKKKRSDLKT